MTLLRNIAVIGHGKSLLNKKSGDIIDACSAVVRMADSNWQLKRKKDYGRRCDVLCGTVINGKAQAYWNDIKWKPNIGAFVWCKRKDPYDMQAVQKQIKPPFQLIKVQNVVDMWQGIYVRCSKEKPGYPFLTRGTVAILSSIDFFNADSVEVFGCDNLKTGSNENFTDYKRGWKLNQKEQSHDYASELKLIKAAEKICNVSINFW